MKLSRACRAGVAGSFVVAAWLASGCGERSRPSGTRPDSTAAGESTLAVPAPPPDTTPPRVSYGAVRIGDGAALVALRKQIGGDRFLQVLKVNRRDSSHVHPKDTLVVPRDSTLALLQLSPFPRELPPLRGRGKLLLVSRRVQAFAAFDSGRLVRWGPTSTGRESLQTPARLYHTNWKDKERTSTFNEEWLLRWYVNLDNFLGISFHQFDLPGYPASHSCIRLLEDDAMWLYAWAESWQLDPKDRRVVLRNGTPVVVFDRYAFGGRPPWKNLAADSTATDVRLSEIEAALAPHGLLGPQPAVASRRD